MPLPIINVFPFIKVHALYKIATLSPEAGDPFGTSKKGNDVIYPMASGPLDEVFNDTSPDEAMFVCYRHADGLPIPRLTKATEDKVPLACDIAAFDVDLNQQFGVKGKLAWTALGEERTEEIEGRIAAAHILLAAEDAPVACYYRSKNGLRFVHVLHTSITPAGLEDLFRRLAAVYTKAGIQVDTACFDWTRCFKVPFCTLQDGTVTRDAPWMRIEWFPDAITFAEPDEINKPPGIGHAGDVLVGECQEASHAREMIEEVGGKLTPAGREASRVISADPMLHGICFGTGTIVEHRGEGKTHNTLTKIIGKLTKRCVGHEWATEQFLFGLIALKVAELGDDEPWLEKAWGMICEYLAQDKGELEERNERIEAEVAEKAELPPKTEVEVFCDGVRQWFPDAVGQPDEEVIEIVKDARLGIVTQQEHGQIYVLSKNGYYTNHSVGADKVSVVLRELEMEWLIPTMVESTGKDGKVKVFNRTWVNYLADDARTYATTRMLCVHRGNYLSKDENGNTQLVISPFWLRDLTPEFNDDIETWLQLAAPDGEAENFIRALVYLLAFQHGPTAALALIGPARVGKKLLAQGLAECINTLQVCPGRALVSRFNDGLVNSPLVWIDEGLPLGKDGIDFADTFRNLVTGGKLYIEPKGKGIFEVAGVHRILITANNDDVISQLGSGHARTQDDLDAISERLAVFRLQQRAADYLKTKNTKGWIAGDNGSPSSNTIAKHLLYHYYHTLDWADGAPVKLGNRLLYEGTRDGFVQATIDEANAELPEIAAQVNEMVRVGQATVRDGLVWVIWNQLQHRCCSSGKTMKAAEFRRAARSLFHDVRSTTINNVPGRYNVAKADRIVSLCSRVATVAPQLLSQDGQ